jgi:hypothetical protein
MDFVDELVCDFLTPEVRAAVTIKSHRGMTSTHALVAIGDNLIFS